MAAGETGDGFLREALHSRRLLGVALIAAIGGFLFGYDTGIIGGALLFMQKDLGLKTAGQQQLTVAILLLGAVTGALIAGWSADFFSRRWTKIVSGCVYVTGALACAFAQTYWQILAGRFWLGLAVGTASFVSPMYIAEIVPPKIRGVVVSFNQLMITSGILAAYIVDWGFSGFSEQLALDARRRRRPGCRARHRDVLHAVLASLARREGPRGRGAGRSERAIATPTRTSSEEVQEIKEVAESEASVRDLLKKGVRRVLLVGIGLAVFQQIVGINTVIYYAPTILKLAGQQNTGALTQSVFIGCTNVFFTIVAILLLDRLGRRFFLLAGRRR